MTTARELPRHISIFDVPRVDRSAIMARAERISELQPLYTISEAMYRAALDYERGLMGEIPIEANRLVRAVVDNPAALMKDYGRPRKRRGPVYRWIVDEEGRTW